VPADSAWSTRIPDSVECLIPYELSHAWRNVFRPILTNLIPDATPGSDAYAEKLASASAHPGGRWSVQSWAPSDAQRVPSIAVYSENGKIAIYWTGPTHAGGELQAPERVEAAAVNTYVSGGGDTADVVFKAFQAVADAVLTRQVVLQDGSLAVVVSSKAWERLFHGARAMNPAVEYMQQSLTRILIDFRVNVSVHCIPRDEWLKCGGDLQRWEPGEKIEIHVREAVLSELASSSYGENGTFDVEVNSSTPAITADRGAPLVPGGKRLGELTTAEVTRKTIRGKHVVCVMPDDSYTGLAKLWRNVREAASITVITPVPIAVESPGKAWATSYDRGGDSGDAVPDSGWWGHVVNPCKWQLRRVWEPRGDEFRAYRPHNGWEAWSSPKAWAVLTSPTAASAAAVPRGAAWHPW
jgi:hypothetical protein